ncbi:SDR family oxidoreductase [Streptodolium elevatio]
MPNVVLVDKTASLDNAGAGRGLLRECRCRRPPGPGTEQLVRGRPFADLDLAELAAGFDGKFWPYVRILQAALPTLRKDGSVTFITAASARAAFPGTAGLAAINGALEAMVPPLAAELAPLRVNAVSPGGVDTPWWSRVPEAQRTAFFEGLAATTPVGRVGQAAEIGEAVYALAANGFVSGVVLDVTGGANLPMGR